MATNLTEVKGYPAGFKMKHEFHSSELDINVCILCGYNAKSHSFRAECEVCGTETKCDFFPDYKHPRKILICESCLTKELRAASEAAAERAKSRDLTASNVKTPGDLFVAETPSIKEIVDSVNSDDSIHSLDKASQICVVIKERILNYQKSIFDLNQQVRETQRLQNESQIYLNHKMKEISAEKQKELGLLDISYKPDSGKVKTPKAAPTTKRVNMDELKKYANQFGIPMAALRNIMLARSVSVEAAAKIFIQINNQVDSVQSDSVQSVSVDKQVELKKG